MNRQTVLLLAVVALTIVVIAQTVRIETLNRRLARVPQEDLPAEAEDTGVFGAIDAAVNGAPELQAVRQWLEENTDSGEWEEVKWQSWPGTEKRSPQDEFRDHTVVRMTFRTANRIGAMQLYDKIFVVSKSGDVEYTTTGPTYFLNQTLEFTDE